jgi:hypothetical protein
MYCVQYRLAWVAPPGTAPNLSLTALMRAEVRVVWARFDRALIGTCAGAGFAPTPATHHFVYATTAIRENALR